MRIVARLVAAVLAALVIARNEAIAPGVPSMHILTGVCIFVVAGGLTFWRDGLLTGSACALGAHYAAALYIGRVEVDFGAPVVAALLVAYLDVADFGMSVPSDRHVDRGLALARLRALALLGGLGAASAAGVFAVAVLPWPSGTPLRLLGLGGAAFAVVAPYLLLRRR